MTAITPPYRGRFAPTPSGPLHRGSLLTALASWLAARQSGGEWWLRIDDLDRPRCVQGAEATIQRQLEAHGLHWDGTPVRQTDHEAEYLAALHRLEQEGLLYPCACTRAVLTVAARSGPDGPIYPGTCRTRPPAAQLAVNALRLKVPDGTVRWDDGMQGAISRCFPAEAGDFFVRRADRQVGYHLACALDERRMGITEVVRGADLLGSTVQQLALMQALQLSPPRYAHLPVLLGAEGRKLSKQNGAAALQTDPASVHQQLAQGLQQLGMPVPVELHGAPSATLLEWAIPYWNPRLLHGLTTLPALP